MKKEFVILVDENDKKIGIKEKISAHREGLLHRAFSIIIYNEKKELLLQKRAMSKYHSKGLWSNACCSHPRPGEYIIDAAHRRLMEELGFKCELKEKFILRYYADLENNLVENEIDHVLIGFKNDNQLTINEDEISELKWASLDIIVDDMTKNLNSYTAWFIKIIDCLNNSTFAHR